MNAQDLKAINEEFDEVCKCYSPSMFRHDSIGALREFFAAGYMAAMAVSSPQPSIHEAESNDPKENA